MISARAYLGRQQKPSWTCNREMLPLPMQSLKAMRTTVDRSRESKDSPKSTLALH
jgi:hypothetical protein